MHQVIIITEYIYHFIGLESNRSCREGQEEDLMKPSELEFQHAEHRRANRRANPRLVSQFIYCWLIKPEWHKYSIVLGQSSRIPPTSSFFFSLRKKKKKKEKEKLANTSTKITKKTDSFIPFPMLRLARRFHNHNTKNICLFFLNPAIRQMCLSRKTIKTMLKCGSPFEVFKKSNNVVVFT